MAISLQRMGQDTNRLGHQPGTGASHQKRLIEPPLGEPLRRQGHRNQPIDRRPVGAAAPGCSDQLAQSAGKRGLAGKLDRGDQAVDGWRVVGCGDGAINQTAEPGQTVADRGGDHCLAGQSGGWPARCFKGQGASRTTDASGALQIEQACAAYPDLRTRIQGEAAQGTSSGQESVEP